MKNNDLNKLKIKLSGLENKLFDEKLRENKTFENKGFGYAQRHAKLGNAFTKRGESLRNRIEVIKTQIEQIEANIPQQNNVYTEMAAKAWLKQFGTEYKPTLS